MIGDKIWIIRLILALAEFQQCICSEKKLIADVSQGIENLNSSYTISIVYGMRGIGKTVFLTAMDRKISAYPDWIVVNLAMGMKLLPSFINSLYLNADSKLKKII